METTNARKQRLNVLMQRAHRRVARRADALESYAMTINHAKPGTFDAAAAVARHEELGALLDEAQWLESNLSRQWVRS